MHFLIWPGMVRQRESVEKKSINECEKKNSQGFFFLIAYRQMTVLDWRFSVEPGSYRRPGADRRWVGGCPEAKASR